MGKQEYFMYICRLMTRKNLFILLIFSVLASGCSNYNRVLKGTNVDQKLELAIELYKKRDYYKALPLFEELITMLRGTRKAEQTYYYYAYTNYQLGDFQSAAYDFENFTRTFPSSELTEECAFMVAYCYFEDSPEYSLDQTNTYKAINELQLFADKYQGSSRIPECNRLIDLLRAKLETKTYETAKLYFNMESYNAAITTFKNLLNDFPSTQYRENALFMSFRAAYLFAEGSIEEKREIRYNEALRAFGEFSVAYPESKFMKDAENIATQIRKKLDKIPSNEVSAKN
jgi:outer membrane protein assembly factor BamD